MLLAHWDRHDLDVVELMNMLLVLAEDVCAEMPEEKLHPWHWLTIALDDQAKLVDPDREDIVAQGRAVRLAERIMRTIKSGKTESKVLPFMRQAA